MKKLMWFIIALIFTLNISAQVYVPNSFSPNNDHINDHIQVYTTDTIIHFDFKIYNTYGKCVYSSQDQNEVWVGGDEYYNGNNVYVYILKWWISGDGFNYYEKRGYINMIR